MSRQVLSILAPTDYSFRPLTEPVASRRVLASTGGEPHGVHAGIVREQLAREGCSRHRYTASMDVSVAGVASSGFVSP